MSKIKEITEKDNLIKIKTKDFTILQHPYIPREQQGNVIWIENEEGEGMSVDLDALWEEKY